MADATETEKAPLAKKYEAGIKYMNGEPYNPRKADEDEPYISKVLRELKGKCQECPEDLERHDMVAVQEQYARVANEFLSAPPEQRGREQLKERLKAVTVCCASCFRKKEKERTTEQ